MDPYTLNLLAQSYLRRKTYEAKLWAALVGGHNLTAPGPTTEGTIGIARNGDRVITGDAMLKELGFM